MQTSHWPVHDNLKQLRAALARKPRRTQSWVQPAKVHACRNDLSAYRCSCIDIYRGPRGYFIAVFDCGYDSWEPPRYAVWRQAPVGEMKPSFRERFNNHLRYLADWDIPLNMHGRWIGILQKKHIYISPISTCVSVVRRLEYIPIIQLHWLREQRPSNHFAWHSSKIPEETAAKEPYSGSQSEDRCLGTGALRLQCRPVAGGISALKLLVSPISWMIYPLVN